MAAQPEDPGVEQLDRVIAHLERTAEELAQQRAGVLDQLREYRVERDRMGIKYVSLTPTTTATATKAAPRFSPVELARVSDFIAEHQGTQTGALAEALDIPRDRAAKLVLELEQRGMVKRTGIKRGTQWWPADEETAPQVAASVTNMQGVVRAAARELGTFTMAELREKCPLSEVTLRRWLKADEAEGIIEAEKVGVTNLFSYVPPDRQQVNRQRRRTPEAEAVSRMPRMRGPQTGSGRRLKTGRPDVDEQLRKATSQGATIIGIDGQNHIIVANKKGETKRLAMTPRGSGNKAKLRELGINV